MTREKQTDDSVRVDLLREAQLQDMGSTEKIRYIIDHIRSGRVVILESGLKPDEHGMLVEMTMTEIDQDTFTGVEIETYPDKKQQSNDSGLLGRMLGKSKQKKTDTENLTVIGPANQMQTLHKDESQISALLNP